MNEWGDLLRGGGLGRCLALKGGRRMSFALSSEEDLTSCKANAQKRSFVQRRALSLLRLAFYNSLLALKTSIGSFKLIRSKLCRGSRAGRL